jgi:hypothetical protein
LVTMGGPATALTNVWLAHLSRPARAKPFRFRWMAQPIHQIAEIVREVGGAVHLENELARLVINHLRGARLAHEVEHLR